MLSRCALLPSALRSTLKALLHSSAVLSAVPLKPRPAPAPKRGGKPQAGSRTPAPEVPRLLSNEALLVHRELRVIDEAGANKGVLSSAAGLALAKSKGLDLVLVGGEAQPPVARVMSLAAELRARRKAASATRAAQSARKLKEIHLTARTGEHDLGIKAGKITAFLEAGSPVRVEVAYSTGSGFLGREESARRAIMEAVMRRVETSGKGFCDPTSISGASLKLVAQFVPVSSPRAAEQWEPVYRLLATPLRTGAAEPHLKAASSGGSGPAAAAAAAGGRASPAEPTGSAAAAAAVAEGRGARVTGGAAPSPAATPSTRSAPLPPTPAATAAASDASSAWASPEEVSRLQAPRAPPSPPPQPPRPSSRPATSPDALPAAETLIKRFSGELAPTLAVKGKGAAAGGDDDEEGLVKPAGVRKGGGRSRSGRLRPVASPLEDELA